MKSKRRAGRPLLRKLLAERNQHPDRAPLVDQKIRRTFERRAAILVLDMCGFSRLTAQYGIIHYLAMIHQMEEAARPAVRSNGGRVIKQDADDLFAIFGNPAEALEAALDIFRAFDAVNIVAPAERDIYGSIGIGYGDLLVVGGDLFGSEVNLACKLGEDLAKKKEILLTESAYEALPRGLYLFEPATFSISGMDINCYRYHAKVGIPAPPSRA